MFPLSMLSMVDAPVVKVTMYIPVPDATGGAMSICMRKGLKMRPPPMPADATRKPPTSETVTSNATLPGLT